MRHATVRAVADPRRRALVAHHRGAPVLPGRHPDSPDPADFGAVRSWLSKRTGRATAIDLFCGAGGLSLGLKRAGFDVLVGADSDLWATRTHDANFPGISWCGDLSDPTEFIHTLRLWGITRVDLVAGGVPCQPFSRAGSSRIRRLVARGERLDHDPRADLWASFVTVVEALRPSAVVVENVPDLPRWNDGEVLIGLYESLRGLGYRVDARVLEGFRHGVPQHRSRLILIGLDGGREPIWPRPVGGLVSLRDAIGDLPPIPPAQRNETLPYEADRQTSRFQEIMRADLTEDERELIRDHICRDVRPDDWEAFRRLREGETYLDLPLHLRRYRSDVFTDKYKRLCWDELCRTITAHIAKDGYWYIHPDQHRTLSVREAARVQSFPDDFRFAGTQTHRYRQIGNAVPVLLAEVVGRSLIRALAAPRRSRWTGEDDVRDRLLRWRATSRAWSPRWRRAGDPWLVMVGEMIFSRAAPSVAERAFDQVRQLAPTPAAFLAISPEDLPKGFDGTRSRIQKLREAARALVKHHGGRVPSDETALRAIPGVGESVSSAVLVFGHDRRRVLTDRAVRRVASRYFTHGHSGRFQMRLDLYRLAGRDGPDSAFNRALLDLARDICVVRGPRCEACPLMTDCDTAKRNVVQLQLDGEAVA